MKHPSRIVVYSCFLFAIQTVQMQTNATKQPLDTMKEGKGRELDLM